MTTASNDYVQFADDFNRLVNAIKAVKSSVNPHFKNRYANLDTWLEQVHEHAHVNGFVFMESNSILSCGDVPYTVHTCELRHVLSGIVQESQYICSEVDKPQAMGSALTYARRYNIQTLLTCTGEDDDDGNVAQSTPANRQERTRVPMGSRGRIA